MSLLTSSQEIPGAGQAVGGFRHADPLAQLSKVFYDRLDRFQLSKVCTLLKLKHRNGATHDSLVKLLDMSLEMRRVRIAQVEQAARQVLQAERDMIERAQGSLEDDEPLDLDAPVLASAPAPAPASDEVLAFALLTMAKKRERLKEIGVRCDRTDDSATLLKKYREAMKI